MPQALKFPDFLPRPSYIERHSDVWLENWQNIQDSLIGLSDGTVLKLAACFVIAVYRYMDIYISRKFLLEEAKKKQFIDDCRSYRDDSSAPSRFLSRGW
jgi:hypothetical protein